MPLYRPAPQLASGCFQHRRAVWGVPAPLKVLGVEEHALQRLRVVDPALQRVLRQQLHAGRLSRCDHLLHQLCSAAAGRRVRPRSITRPRVMSPPAEARYYSCRNRHVWPASDCG